ncbi:uncharacterized protein LOC119574301, partial [Penaeus monodon]|uniref:uncharacterized protein LOC119574301 n=1 Tax=Penaeus monodon TaxID=6687 RepID=UPI0018A70C26
MFSLAVVEEENIQLEEQAMSSMPEDSAMTAESASESAHEQTLRKNQTVGRDSAERSGFSIDKIREMDDKEAAREPKEYAGGGQWLVQVNEITQTCDVMRMENDDYADALEPNTLEAQRHVFKAKKVKKSRPCHVCHQPIVKLGSCCRVCKYLVHKACEPKMSLIARVPYPMRVVP